MPPRLSLRLLLFVALSAVGMLGCALSAATPAAIALPTATPTMIRLDTFEPAGATIPPATPPPSPTPPPAVLIPTAAPAVLLPATSAPLDANPVNADLANQTPIAQVAAVEPLSIPSQLALIEPNRMVSAVDQLVLLGNRHALSQPAAEFGAAAARDLLIRQFEQIQQANPHVPIDVFTHTVIFNFHGQAATADNIVLVIRGSDAAYGAIVVGAHYDTVGKNMGSTDTIQPGADDNASGVAAVLELARVMSQSPRRTTMFFVMFGAEELGRFGSRGFAEQFLPAQGLPVRAMLNLDMIGNATGPDGIRRDNQVRIYSAPPYDSPSRQLARLIARITNTYVPDMTVVVHDTLDRMGRWGDHQSFSDMGYPAVRLVEPVDDPSYMHSPNDLPSYLDYAYIQRVTQVVLATLLVLDGSPPGPTVSALE